MVRGLGDGGGADYPEETVVTVCGVRIGLLHGHQCLPWGDVDALGAVQRRLGCDILVSGHTHRQRVYKYENRLLVDPGSATGAFTPGEVTTPPSFCLLDVGGEPWGRVVVYCYSLEAGEVKVQRIEHTLELGGEAPPHTPSKSEPGAEVGVGAVAPVALPELEPEPEPEPETTATPFITTEQTAPVVAPPEIADPFAPFAASPSAPGVENTPDLTSLGDPFLQGAPSTPSDAMQDPFASPEPAASGETAEDPFAASPNLL